MALFRPDEWREFFLTVGGGAAALTGFLVVAISLHLDMIVTDPALRHRARTILLGLGAVFVRCSLALMGGQGARAIGLELFSVTLLMTVLALVSYAAVAKSGAPHRSVQRRTVGVIGFYGLEMTGAALLFFGVRWGLNIAAVAMVANFYFVLSGSWLLLLGAREDESRAR